MLLTFNNHCFSPDNEVFTSDRFHLIDVLEVWKKAHFDLLLCSNTHVLLRRSFYVQVADVGAIRVRVGTVLVPPEVEWCHLYVTTTVHQRDIQHAVLVLQRCPFFKRIMVVMDVFQREKVKVLLFLDQVINNKGLLKNTM